MSNAFFYDLLASVAERGRSMLKIKPWPKDADNRVDQLVADCRALVAGQGEASGIALAAEILGRYRALDPSDHGAFFRALADDFGPDRERVREAVASLGSDGDEARLSEIHYASEPRRHELFRRLNRAPGGTATLVAMRADLIQLMNQNPSLAIVDRDFLHLFGSWFNRGFLVLRRIDWSSPAALLEKIIRYEAVHEIGDWDELRRRIDPADRRCYAFFHPRLVDEPLIFVEVALTLGAPAAIAPLLAEKRAHIAPDKARVAAFYSISNCQRGLAGVNFGNFLIKQVVEEIRRELPAIETFVTLSPVPGLRAWLETTEDPAIMAMKTVALQLAAEDPWANASGAAARLRAALEPLAAYYFLKARRPDGRVLDPVARFHLGNGARLERIDWEGDLSPKGLAESFGIMVNYLYDLDEIERNHEAFVNRGQIAASAAVKKLVPAAPSPARGFAGRFGVECVSQRKASLFPHYDGSMDMTAEEIATIRIELIDTDPPIWREVEVATSISLKTLHAVIQAAFGWRNYHLWEFSLGKRRYGTPSDEDWREEPLVDAGKVRLADLLGPRKTKIDYLYDFGDCWEHRLTVSDVRAGDPDCSYPRYVAGERNGPPEDCGGIPGFYDKLETAADPDHPDHAEIKRWLGDYDADTIDEALIKRALGRLANRGGKARARKKKPA